MTDHAVYEEQICAMLDGELSEAEEASLRAHLNECEECRAFLAAMEAVHGLAARDLPEAPAELTKNVMARVRAEAAPEKKTGKIRHFPFKPLAAAAAAAVVLWAGARIVPAFRPKGMSAAAPASGEIQAYSAVAAEEAPEAPQMDMGATTNGALYGAAESAATAEFDAAAVPVEEAPPTLTIRGTEVLLDGEPVPLTELEDRLKETNAADLGVELDFDEAAEETVGAIMDLLDELQIPRR